MEYVMYVLIVVVCGIILYDWLQPNKRADSIKAVSEKPKPVETEAQVIQFPDEVVVLPKDIKCISNIPDISDWTPPMNEIFHLITKDRKNWVFGGRDRDTPLHYYHKEFKYVIRRIPDYFNTGKKWVLQTKLLSVHEAENVLRLSEVYFKSKYYSQIERLNRLNVYKKNKAKIQARQQEADKINEYLATLKKG